MLLKAEEAKHQLEQELLANAEWEKEWRQHEKLIKRKMNQNLQMALKEEEMNMNKKYEVAKQELTAKMSRKLKEDENAIVSTAQQLVSERDIYFQVDAVKHLRENFADVHIVNSPPPPAPPPVIPHHIQTPNSQPPPPLPPSAPSSATEGYLKPPNIHSARAEGLGWSPFECTCGKGFGTRAALDYHLQQSMESQRPPAVSSEDGPPSMRSSQSMKFGEEVFTLL